MDEDKIQAEIKLKLDLSKRYGIKFIHIHGIGASNVKNIKECVQRNKEFFDYFERHIYEKDNLIILELLLK
ncbi:MAG: hypothetical protein ACE5FT_06740 [Candidatus Nanoarchaeia archaeon]